MLDTAPHSFAALLPLLQIFSALGSGVLPSASLPFPEINPSALTLPAIGGIGPFHLRWYALAYIAGLLLGWRYIVSLIRSEPLWKPGQVRPDAAALDDFLLWAALGVILGGRLGYVLFYMLPAEETRAALFANPLIALQVWEGGMAFHGGLLGVLIAIVLFARKRNIPMLTLGDVVAAATPIGLFFGRCANFINGELYGRPTDAPWGVRFPYWDQGSQTWVYPADAVARHPSQLYEAFLEGVVLFLILRALTHRFHALRSPGMTAGAFLVGYGAFRTFVEFFREPDAHLPDALRQWFTLGMAYSIPMLIAGAALIYWVARKRRETASGGETARA